MSKPADKSLMRSLGEFFGHIAKGIKTDPATVPPPARKNKPHRSEVGRKVEEETRDTPTGKITLRRTTIEEVEFRPDEPQKPSGPPRSSGQQ